MNGRDLERLAQQNINWAKSGLTQKPKAVEKPPVAEVKKPFEKVTEKSEPSKTTINSIKINGSLLKIKKFDNPDLQTKLNCELLEFMFSKYSQHGMLPISDLVQFIEKNNLKLST